MKRRLPRQLVAALAPLLLVSVLAALPALAQVRSDPAPLQFQGAAEEARFHALAAELRCVMCQNQSLADSNAQIAYDLRAEVLQLIREGRSDDEIREFLVARYGEFVLYRPRFGGHTWALWLAPSLLLLVGGVVIVRRRSAGAPTAAPREDEQEW